MGVTELVQRIESEMPDDTERPMETYDDVLAVFEAVEDYCEFSYGHDKPIVRKGKLFFYLDCSDTFWWGCADGESVTPDKIPILKSVHDDLKAIDEAYDRETNDTHSLHARYHYTGDLFAARVRKLRPQGACYPKVSKDVPLFVAKAVAKLYDACGPEREVGIGNPKPRPTYEEGSDA